VFTPAREIRAPAERLTVIPCAAPCLFDAERFGEKELRRESVERRIVNGIRFSL
jgi:hypothetical protein